MRYIGRMQIKSCSRRNLVQSSRAAPPTRLRYSCFGRRDAITLRRQFSRFATNDKKTVWQTYGGRMASQTHHVFEQTSCWASNSVLPTQFRRKQADRAEAATKCKTANGGEFCFVLFVPCSRAQVRTTSVHAGTTLFYILPGPELLSSGIRMHGPHIAGRRSNP